MNGSTFGPISATFRPHLSDEERYAVRHKPGDEMNVSPEAAELRHDCRRLKAASVGQCRGELGTPIECVMALAGLDLDILGGDGGTFLAGEGCHPGSAGPRPTAHARLP